MLPEVKCLLTRVWQEQSLLNSRNIFLLNNTFEQDIWQSFLPPQSPTEEVHVPPRIMPNPEVKGQPGNSLQNAYSVFKKQELLKPQVG